MPIYVYTTDDETGEEKIFKQTGTNAMGDAILSPLSEEELQRLEENKNKRTHPAITLPYKDGEVEIDEPLVGLIQFLWDNNIETISSCQGDKKEANIAFADYASAESCLQLLTLGHKDALPAPKGWSNPFSRVLPGKWLVFPASDGACGVMLSISWHFNLEKIDLILTNLTSPIKKEK